MAKQNRRFRYNTVNKWFKGNTHIHSTVSDGGKTLMDLAELYSKAGYQFLCRTDHWVFSNVEADKAQYPLLWLDGAEIDGKDNEGSYYHVLCIGRIEGIKADMDLTAIMESARKQNALVILPHPFWTGNTAKECRRWNFDGVEIYNHVSSWLNGKGESVFHWNEMLRKNPNVLGFAADDAHISLDHPGWNGGWIVVNAPECSREEITKAIRSGNYYSSCGPEIYSMKYDEVGLAIETSPIRFARLVGPGWCGDRVGTFYDQPFTRACMRVPLDWKYVYLEIEDSAGKRAWSNNLFTE